MEEFFNKLWFAYPADLCRGKKGGKAPALAALKKLNPDEAEQKRILANLEAQKRYDRQDPEAYRWPFLSSYLNQRRFDDDIPSTAELKRSLELKQCSMCSSPVHGPKYDLCSDHVLEVHDRLKEKRKRFLIDNGLYTGKESRSELALKCVKYCESRGLKFGNVLKKMSDHL